MASLDAALLYHPKLAILLLPLVHGSLCLADVAGANLPDSFLQLLPVLLRRFSSEMLRLRNEALAGRVQTIQFAKTPVGLVHSFLEFRLKGRCSQAAFADAVPVDLLLRWLGGAAAVLSAAAPLSRAGEVCARR